LASISSFEKTTMILKCREEKKKLWGMRGYIKFDSAEL